MFGTHDLTLFIVSGLLLNMVPGPDSLLIMTRSATQGWRAGSSAALGIGSGTLVHIFAAALGLSAVLATSATAFMIVKLAGAAYLLYVGVQLLLSKAKAAQADPAEPPPARLGHRQIFLQGFMTNVLNPKVAVFFLAFVPQFISAGAASKPLAFILLGFIFNINGMLWCHFLAVSTALASHKIKINTGLVKWLNRLIGGVFVSFGLKLALSKQ
ncbi:MAG: LysE family translocator [Pseudomonadota bacterium]